MRIAFVSPLPPQKSGIADYSEALLNELKPRVDVDVFTTRPAGFDPSRYDGCIYQIGNNPFHIPPYEMALEYPGVVVVHEANLHHLITELTIRRGDWDAYLGEVEYNGTAEDSKYALQYVRTLERGPDYEGIPMLRRLLERSKGAIVHSRCVEAELRRAGFEGPISRIWHGAWVVEPERMEYRERLGLDESTPLIGIFGFLKPYKRIAESLRAFRRIVRLEPAAKMILVGEPHPELPLDSLIQTLDLGANVRVIGFAPIEDFNGYMGACDMILNLRYPTVGESSGTLLRALGMGKAVVVSDVGSFSEYPDDVCLKAPVDASEEDHLFEYMNLLISRSDVVRTLGEHAKAWVRDECSWRLSAERYVEFLREVAAGTAPRSTPEPARTPAPAPCPDCAVAQPAEPAAAKTEELAKEVVSWTAPEAKRYVASHITRLARTLEITPRGEPNDRVLEMGAYLQITPALRTKLGYGEVRGCYFGELGEKHHRQVTAEDGTQFECDLELFNAEKDTFPYEDGYFSTVLCCELIEHLFADPMHMMSEINRILRMDGHLVLTTPNIVSLRAAAGILQGYQPGLFPSYIKPRADGQVDARHNREYTPREVSDLLQNSGFKVTLLETGPFLDEPQPQLGWVQHMLERYILPADLRGDGIYAVGRKTGPVRERYPEWLYS